MPGTLNDRIKTVVHRSELTKTEFASRINISQPHLSRLCSGENKPSDRTISDICDKFHINETWLRTGEGVMEAPVNRDAEIAAFMGDVMRSESEDFRRRMVAVLTKLDVEEWELLEKMALKLAEETKKEGQA